MKPVSSENANNFQKRIDQLYERDPRGSLLQERVGENVINCSQESDRNSKTRITSTDTHQNESKPGRLSNIPARDTPNETHIPLSTIEMAMV